MLFTVDDEGRTESSGTLKDEIAKAAPPFIFAMLLLISIFVGTGALLQSVTEEKENRMVEMLITSTSPLSIMIGKIAGLGAAGLVQIAIWLTAVVITVPQISSQFSGLSALNLEIDLVLLLIAFYFAGYFVFEALMASIGAASTTVREASQISAIVIIPAIIPIYGAALIIPNPDGIIARVLTYFPLTSPTASMMRMAGGTHMTYEIIIGLAITALSGVFLMWAQCPRVPRRAAAVRPANGCQECLGGVEAGRLRRTVWRAQGYPGDESLYRSPHHASSRSRIACSAPRFPGS